MDAFQEFMAQQEQNTIRRNRRRSQMMQAAGAHIMELEEEEVKKGGSTSRRRVIRRDRHAMDERLKSLYFTSPCRFEGYIFRRRYRMRPNLFDKMMCDVVNHDQYFVQREDAISHKGFSTEQKLTCAMRMLAYGIPADLCDEFLDIAESTAL